MSGLNIVQSFDENAQQDWRYSPEEKSHRRYWGRRSPWKNKTIATFSIHVYCITNLLLLVGRAFWCLLTSFYIEIAAK